jgi:hypothetical protein
MTTIGWLTLRKEMRLFAVWTVRALERYHCPLQSGARSFIDTAAVILCFSFLKIVGMYCIKCYIKHFLLLVNF